MNINKEVLKLEKLYRENKLAHVYLIETNNLEKATEDIINLIKMISCPYEYQENCLKCNFCNLIVQNNMPSIMIIEPNGQFIKKEQVIELKQRFSLMPAFTENNIYIIKNADKLNAFSANTLLKFIEEPSGQVIGFLITLNINNVLPTIKSRCETCQLFYENTENNDLVIYQECISEYLKKIEVEKKGNIIYNKDILLANFNQRKDIELIFKEILNIYNCYLHYKITGFLNIEDNYSYLKELKIIQLEKRIKLVIDLLDNINRNLNIELLLDKFIIELSEIYE